MAISYLNSFQREHAAFQTIFNNLCRSICARAVYIIFFYPSSVWHYIFLVVLPVKFIFLCPRCSLCEKHFGCMYERCYRTLYAIAHGSNTDRWAHLKILTDYVLRMCFVFLIGWFFYFSKSLNTGYLAKFFSVCLNIHMFWWFAWAACLTQ